MSIDIYKWLEYVCGSLENPLSDYSVLTLPAPIPDKEKKFI